MCKNNEFNCDLVKFGIDFYIGPPGTAPVRNNFVFNSWGIKEKIKENAERKQKNRFNNYSLYNNHYNNIFN